MGVHVKAVDRSDFVGKVASAGRLDEIYMTSAPDMVHKVLGYLRKNKPYSRVCAPGQQQTAKISRLDIVDHGSSSSVQIGKDRVTTANFDVEFRAILLALTPHFEATGFAHLQHCNAGQNIPLLEMFADTWRVPVVAGEGQDVELIVTEFNWSKYVRVYPKGSTGRRAPTRSRWRP